MADGGPVPIGELRPDLPVPLRPAGMVGAMLRYVLALPHTPAFARAHRQTSGSVAAALLLLVVGQMGFALDVRDTATVAGVMLVVYTTLRSVALRVLEHGQHAFELIWLAERSATLRAGSFEVIRCTVDGRTYDLTEPESVQDVFGTARADSRVEVDFLSSVGKMEQAFRHMGEVTIRRVLRPGAPARVRFAEARYGVDPGGEQTYWQLGSQLTLTTSAPADPVTGRDGTGSRARSGGAPQADARHARKTSA